MEHIAAGLRTRREDLRRELGDLTKPPEAGANVSFGKRVGDGTTEAVERFSTTATARVLAQGIAAIDHALSRVEDGTYGVCLGCGRDIPPDRLEAIPATVVCVECSALRKGEGAR